MPASRSEAKNRYLDGLNRASESDWPTDAESVEEAAEALESAYGTDRADFNEWASRYADRY